MVKVKLEGLKIARARGKWYVYIRSTGGALIKGLPGDRAALEREMATPAFLEAYNSPRTRARPAQEYGAETLGSLIYWFTNGDIDRTAAERKTSDQGAAEGYPKWYKLAPATRADYLEAFDYLRDSFIVPVAEITQPELYQLRDACARKKWPRFADQMISALSSMFTQGVRRGNMPTNPCRGMDKAHSADPNANREWYPEELPAALARAPMEVKIVLMLARYGGLRGQSIVGINWKQYRAHNITGMAFRLVTRKNKNGMFLPALPELQQFLSSIKRVSPLIAIRDDGTAWPSEKEMQTRVSHYLRDLERAEAIEAGTTLHGLRVSYAAWWKRNGANNSEVADLLGDKSERMGAHYTRHVESEANVIRAFQRVKDAG